jgi:hypothetical protein
MNEELTLYCVNHPQTETTLRCSRCENPICIRCAVRTPTGYRCRTCVRGQQKAFETTEWYDYPVAIVVAGVLAFLGSLIVPRLSFFTIFLAPIAGTVIAEIVRMLLRRRRSPRLFRLTAIATALGGLPLLLLYLSSLFIGATGGGSLFRLLPLLWQALYVFLVTSTMYYRLSGIQVRR